MSPSFDPRPSRDFPERKPQSFEDLKLRTLQVGTMQELAALRRPEGPRLQFEGFVPVIVPPLPGVREEIRDLADKLRCGTLSKEELHVLSEHVATSTFPRDDRGQELCRKLIEGLNTLKRMVMEDPSGSLDPMLRRDLPLSRREQREYALRFSEMQFPPALFSDELGRVLWRGFITDSLPPHEEALLHSIINKTGRGLVAGSTGLTMLSHLGDRDSLF